MGDSSRDMLISRVNEENFMFAFNDCDFSDRVLRLEIIPNDDDSTIDSSKKLIAHKYHDWFSCIQAPHSKDSESCDGSKDETLLIEPCNGAKVKTLHISSPILAAKSAFFYELFKNGMRESQQKNDVSFKIKASEEATLMDLLNFMYGNTLSVTSSSDLVDVVDVLMVADKFKVTSCMRYCVQMLLEFPMSLESSLFYLELPFSVSANEIVKPLIDVAKQHVIVRYKEFTKSQEEFMDLPLSIIEVVLGNEDLQVISEDHVFNFILKWARNIYPELEERRAILTKRLLRFICFPNMSCSKLKEVLVCPDFDDEKVSKLVLKALFSKVEISCGQHIHASKDLATIDCGFSRRIYSPHCVVYFDLKKHEIRSLVTSKDLQSQSFCLGGKRLHLLAQCKREEHQFGLYMCKAQASETCTLDFEFAVMNKSSMEFQSKLKVNNYTLGEYGYGKTNLLGIVWSDLMSDDCEYFINDILHLRAEVTLNNSKA